MAIEGRLKGRGLRTEGAARTEAPKFVHGSLTVGLEFGNFGAGVGDLQRDGFEARISNYSKGQDAVAVSADKKVFAVCDGLGGTAAMIPKTVSQWSRMVAEAVVQVGKIRPLISQERFVPFVKSLKEAMERRGVDFKLQENIRGKSLGVMTTLSAAERVGPSSFDIVAIGDSPIYVIDKDTGAIIRQYGEDIIRGETSAPIINVVGMNQDGVVHDLDRETQMEDGKRGDYLVDERITLEPGQLLVIGSDFFSDHTFVGRNLKEYIGLTPTQFHANATEPDAVKFDDATLVVIDPEKLPPFAK